MIFSVANQQAQNNNYFQITANNPNVFFVLNKFYHVDSVSYVSSLFTAWPIGIERYVKELLLNSSSMNKQINDILQGY